MTWVLVIMTLLGSSSSIFFLFSHGFSLEVNFVSIVHQAVEDGIGEGGVADAVVPFFGR